MPYSEILNVVLPTFVVIIIGYAIGKFFQIDMAGVVDIVFYVGLPALGFVSIIGQQIILIDAAGVWAASFLVTAGCGCIGWILFKIKREKHTSLYLPISLPNTVNIPFPIVTLAYGPAGLFVAMLFYIPNVILMYSVGVYLAAGQSRSDNLKAVLKVPAIYAVILGLVFNLFQVNVPALIIEPLELIGSMVIPLVLFTLGFSLSKIKVTAITTTILASLIRVGGGLAIGFLVTILFDMTGVIRSVVILMSAMPAAVNTYLLAAKYKNEAELVASVVLVTTVASLVMIPFLLKVLG